jgi:hypothetical protein
MLGFLLTLPLFLITALLTHLTVSLSQTIMHYTLAHRPLGGRLFRNHVGFHHRYYSKYHLVSKKYLAEEGNLTPFFFIPVFFHWIIELFGFAARPLRHPGSGLFAVVLCPRLFRQGISRRGIVPAAIFLV